MSAHDHHDGLDTTDLDATDSGAAVHGLLATAFADDLPVLNLVPAAVDGYRRHRRRARVLGTAGGALALAGIVAAGTALAAGAGSRATPPAAEDSSGSEVQQLLSGDCSGSYYRFGQYNGSGVYSADQGGLANACAQDIIALNQLTGSGLRPVTESTKDALAKHDLPAGAAMPPYGSGLLIQPGLYDGWNGTAYRISILISDKIEVFGTGCSPQSCPPNRTLADGRTATEVASGPHDTLVIHYDKTHIVTVDAFLTEHTSAKQVPFDFEGMIASPGFAQLISADVRALNQLTHPA